MLDTLFYAYMKTKSDIGRFYEKNVVLVNARTTLIILSADNVSLTLSEIISNRDDSSLESGERPLLFGKHD